MCGAQFHYWFTFTYLLFLAESSPPQALSPERTLTKAPVTTLGDDENDDSASESGVYEVKYEVAVAGVAVMTDFTLLTTASFRDFQHAVAEHMGVSVLQLSALGYVMSFWSKSPKPLPKLVDSDERYESMLGDLHDHVSESSKKKGKAKPVIIRIVELSEKDSVKKV